MIALAAALRAILIFHGIANEVITALVQADHTEEGVRARNDGVPAALLAIYANRANLGVQLTNAMPNGVEPIVGNRPVHVARLSALSIVNDVYETIGYTATDGFLQVKAVSNMLRLIALVDIVDEDE